MFLVCKDLQHVHIPRERPMATGSVETEQERVDVRFVEEAESSDADYFEAIPNDVCWADATAERISRVLRWVLSATKNECSQREGKQSYILNLSLDKYGVRNDDRDNLGKSFKLTGLVRSAYGHSFTVKC